MAKKKQTQGKGKQTFKNLLSPTRIGNVELKNRIAVAPMQEHMTHAGGEISEQTLAYIGARAKGGAGLVISGVFLGTRLAAQFPLVRSMVLYHQGHQFGPVRRAHSLFRCRGLCADGPEHGAPDFAL
jgi:2,4-dienoyl-CoA reductase-like NADH-dependent reductase (Old Yellow Enzyme family)